VPCVYRVRMVVSPRGDGGRKGFCCGSLQPAVLLILQPALCMCARARAGACSTSSSSLCILFTCLCTLLDVFVYMCMCACPASFRNTHQTSPMPTMTTVSPAARPPSRNGSPLRDGPSTATRFTFMDPVDTDTGTGTGATGSEGGSSGGSGNSGRGAASGRSPSPGRATFMSSNTRRAMEAVAQVAQQYLVSDTDPHGPAHHSDSHHTRRRHQEAHPQQAHSPRVVDVRRVHPALATRTSSALLSGVCVCGPSLLVDPALCSSHALSCSSTTHHDDCACATGHSLTPHPVLELVSVVNSTWY
jgi:hypothetical protein